MRPSCAQSNQAAPPAAVAVLLDGQDAGGVGSHSTWSPAVQAIDDGARHLRANAVAGDERDGVFHS